MINPLKLAVKTKKIVCKNFSRKYYRFRAAKFYGGIATADCVGCFLRCKYCWAWSKLIKPDKVGRFYKPKDVVENLSRISKKSGFSQVRISGNEPTIGKEHLLKVLELIEEKLSFILETNGILIDEAYANELSKFDRLHVRVSIKGASPDEFSRISGASKKFFQKQLDSLKNLIKYNVSCHASLLADFSSMQSLSKLRSKLESIQYGLGRKLELESLIRYPQVMKRLKKAGLI